MEHVGNNINQNTISISSNRCVWMVDSSERGFSRSHFSDDKGTASFQESPKHSAGGYIYIYILDIS